MESTFAEMIERNALWYGDRVAFKCGDTAISHAEFFRGAARIGNALCRIGLRPQDRVSMLSMNSVEFALAYGACELHGFIGAAVNFRLAPPEMEYILRDSGSTILVFEDIYAGHVDEIRQRLPDVQRYICIGDAPAWATPWHAFVESGDADACAKAHHKPRPEDLAYLLYTSGTTGQPKGCMLDHRAETESAAAIALAMQLGSNDKTLLMMPMFHIGAKIVSLAQQWVGGTVVLQRKYDAVAVLAAIQDERITATHMAPTLVQGLLDVPQMERYDVSTLKRVLYSAAPMSPALLRRALAVFGPIFQQIYGQTEGIGTLLPLSAHELDGDPANERRLHSLGHPFIGCEVSIRDEMNRALPVGEAGEICLRGHMVMRGYWNRSAATIAALEGGWLHTGDIGSMDTDGYVYLLDRKKDMIITGGENVYSREVENALLQHPGLDMVAVIGLPDPKWGEQVCAVVVPKPGHATTPGELTDHCRRLIAGYKVPRQYRVVDSLPLLPTGKVNKIRLREQVGVQ